MNLKGYDWKDENNKTIMSYSLKFATIYIHDKTTTVEDVQNFKKFLLKQGMEVLTIE